MKEVTSGTLLSISIWLIAAAPLHAGVFNVRDYGAVADDKTDNTAAFSKCLDAVIAAGGGQMFLSTGDYNVQSSQPTYGTKGLITPANNNAALTLLRNITVTGYHTGIVVNEHTHGDHIVLGSNIHGLEFNTANHSSRFDRVSAMRNTHHITVTGKHGFSIGQLNIENSGPGQTAAHNEWQKLAYDINDPKNLGIADITYWVVEGNVGMSEKFTINGGANIRARRIGQALPENDRPSNSLPESSK